MYRLLRKFGGKLGRVLHARMSRGNDPVMFRVENSGDGNPVLMSTAGGRDQVACTVAKAGWREYEAPLPVARGRGCAWHRGIESVR